MFFQDAINLGYCGQIMAYFLKKKDKLEYMFSQQDFHHLRNDSLIIVKWSPSLSFLWTCSIWSSVFLCWEVTTLWKLNTLSLSVFQTYVHTCIHTYKPTYTHTHANIHIHIHTYIHTYIGHVYIHSYTHRYIYTYIRTYIYTYIHTYTYIHIYILKNMPRLPTRQAQTSRTLWTK